jgi:hypothetical protein
MRSKTVILSTAAVLAFAGAVITPGYARTHHRMHHMASHSSTPAERAQTADLNRQQLQQAQTASAGSGNPALSTTDTSYQKPGSAGMSGTASGENAGSTSTGNTAPQEMAPAGTDAATPATPNAPATPPPADTSGGTQ